MDLIIDANILFAALIRKGATVELMLDQNMHLFAPEFILDEFLKYQTEILDITKRTQEEFFPIFESLKQIITLVPLEEFKDYLPKAREVCPAPEDVQYFALALKLNCPIWTNEKKLKNQTQVKIYTTAELLRGIF